MANQTAKSSTDGQSGGVHFVMVPFLAPGHMTPMADVARLLAERDGVVVTLATTPKNISRFRGLIDRADRTGLPVRFVELPFPSAHADPTDGWESENIDTIEGDKFMAFFQLLPMLAEPLAAYLRECRPRPSCIVSDFCHPWTHPVAEEFGVPRLVFHGMCCFPHVCLHNIESHNMYDRVGSDSEPFVVPGPMPHRVVVTKAQAPGFFNESLMAKTKAAVETADAASLGVVVNSFDELEPEYVELYRKATGGKKVWMVGPVSLCNRDPTDLAVRGNRASIDEYRCRTWLDSMRPGSVVYVSFGSITRTTPNQVVELGLGLEGSSHPFIWVLKGTEITPEVEAWLHGGFEERIKGRALIIRGWAPQMAILSHPAVGGFVTHCGWNSSMEAITAGLPVVTWPFYADQFLNERFLVDVLQVGVAVGIHDPAPWKFDEGAEAPVKREAVEEAVRELMGGGDEGEGRRRRVRELGEKARKAMEACGSSYINMTTLIQDVSRTLPLN